MYANKEAKAKMALLTSIEAHELLGADGVVLGSVQNLLFHPSEPRVVGVMVRPPAALVVVQRPETFLPLEGLAFTKAGTSVELKKLPGQRKGAEGLGFDPDTTVIWAGMPVRTPSGREIGIVRDVEFDPASGAVGRMEVAAGMVADAAHGRFVVPGASVLRYSEGAIEIGLEAGELEASGGLAKTAASTLVAASATASALGEQVGDVVVSASGAAGRAIKAVSDSKVAEKTTARVKSTWRDSVKAFRDGMKDE